MRKQTTQSIMNMIPAMNSSFAIENTTFYRAFNWTASLDARLPDFSFVDTHDAWYNLTGFINQSTLGKVVQRMPMYYSRARKRFGLFTYNTIQMYHKIATPFRFMYSFATHPETKKIVNNFVDKLDPLMTGRADKMSEYIAHQKSIRFRRGATSFFQAVLGALEDIRLHDYRRKYHDLEDKQGGFGHLYEHKDHGWAARQLTGMKIYHSAAQKRRGIYHSAAQNRKEWTGPMDPIAIVDTNDVTALWTLLEVNYAWIVHLNNSKYNVSGCLGNDI